MPISFCTNYFLRDGETLPPRSEGIVTCDDSRCRIVSFSYTRQVMHRGRTKEVKELVSGVFNTEVVYNEGATGKVYQVHRLNSKTGMANPHPAFAIKVMPVSIEQAEKEVQFLKRIGFATSGSMEEGRSYIVMPYIQGISLETLLDSSISQITFVDRLNILAQVTGSIQSLQENFRMLHRDITLRNFLVSRQRHGLKVDLVDYGDAEDISETNFSLAGRQAVLHLPPKTLRDKHYGPGSEVSVLAHIAYALLGVKDPLKNKREAYLHAKAQRNSQAWQEIVHRSLNVEGLYSFDDWRIAETGLNFHAIVTTFIKRMELELDDANKQPNIDETARFFRCLYYIGAIKNFLSNPDLPDSEVKRFNLENEKYACMLILLAAGKWRQLDHYDCSQVNFDSAFGFCHNVMTDRGLMELIEAGEWEKVGAQLTTHLAAIEEVSEAVLFNATNQKLLETLEIDFVNRLNEDLLEFTDINFILGQFTAFFSRFNQLRQCLDPASTPVSAEIKKQVVAELLVVIHGYWKNPKSIEGVQLREGEEEGGSLFDDLCLAEYPELCSLIGDLHEQGLIDAKVLQRLIDQLPFDADPRSLSQRLRQFTQKAEWAFILTDERWDEAPLLEPLSMSDSSLSSTSSSSSLPRCGASHNLSDLERQEADEIGQEALEVAKETMSAILTQGFFAPDESGSSGERSRSLSLVVCVGDE